MSGVLVVEDDPQLGWWMEQVLSRAGFVVTSTKTVAEARSLLKPGTYNVVVTDWKLPDGSGALLAREAIAAGAATLVISGYGLSLPADAFEGYACLWKPFNAEDLLGAINRQLALASAPSPSSASCEPPPSNRPPRLGGPG